MRWRLDAVLRLGYAVQETVADAAAKESFSAPGPVRNQNRLPGHVIVRVVDKESKRLVFVLRAARGSAPGRPPRCAHNSQLPQHRKSRLRLSKRLRRIQ